VLDPFCGTGRALEAAKRLGRNVIGFDAQSKFVELSASKLQGNMKSKNLRQLDKGNYVSEWFGQRIYPNVRLDVAALTGKRFGCCPFLSNILNSTTACVKNENSYSVCTISSCSNGVRQDWLVCPYRVIDSDIVKQAIRRIFGLNAEVLPRPVSILKRAGELEKFKNEVRDEGVGYLFFQDKLGGEISVSATERSPEMAFDVTLVEIKFLNGIIDVSRYGILEIQTMDFHGSYKHAVSDLRDALRLHKRDFPEELAKKPEWAGDKVEGPNIANVFKRTFYQVMLKFKLSGQGAAAGTVLALPKSVWDSWHPFLGAPVLQEEAPGVKRFKIGEESQEQANLNSYICVFDLDAQRKEAISPARIEHFIRVSPDRLSHHAFTQVPENMLHAIQSNDSILSRIRSRLSEWWPDLLPE